MDTSFTLGIGIHSPIGVYIDQMRLQPVQTGNDNSDRFVEHENRVFLLENMKYFLILGLL